MDFKCETIVNKNRIHKNGIEHLHSLQQKTRMIDFKNKNYQYYYRTNNIKTTRYFIIQIEYINRHTFLETALFLEEGWIGCYVSLV